MTLSPMTYNPILQLPSRDLRIHLQISQRTLMLQSLTIVKVRRLAVYAKGFTLETIVSLAVGATRHLYAYTIALDLMLAIIAPADQGGSEIANEVVTALSFFAAVQAFVESL